MAAPASGGALTPAGGSAASLQGLASPEKAGTGRHEEEGFTDFTLATPWERFSATIEHCLHTWVTKDIRRTRERLSATGQAPQQLTLTAQLQHRLPFRSSTYSLSLHVPPGAEIAPCAGSTRTHSTSVSGACLAAGPGATAAAANTLLRSGLSDQPHKVQEWFGLGPFLLLSPDSYSGRVLDEAEAHTLLSAGAAALSHTRLAVPLIIPVHDALRDGARGLALVAGAIVRLESDSTHTSSLPAGLLRLDEQLKVFAARLAPHAPAAAAACWAALEGQHGLGGAGGGSGNGCSGVGQQLGVAASLRRCYPLPYIGDVDEDFREEAEILRDDWDVSAAWRPWAAQSDPVCCLELDAVWRFSNAAEALQAAASPEAWEAEGEEWQGEQQRHAAAGRNAARVEGQAAAGAEWRIVALGQGYERDTGARSFMLKLEDVRRDFMRLQSILGSQAEAVMAEPLPASQLPSEDSFHGMLSSLLESCKWVARTSSMGDLASEDWWLQQGAYQPRAPASWVLQDAMRDIFEQPGMPVWPGTQPAAAGGSMVHESKPQAGSSVGKAAPLGSLISRFALHALVLNSPRAIAQLWSRFVHELRVAHWEPLVPLPRMGSCSSTPSSDRSTNPHSSTRPASHADQAAAGGAADMAISVADQAGSTAGGGGLAQAWEQQWSPGGGRGSEQHAGRPPAPDLQYSLLHQKLQLLDLCIHMQQQQQQRKWDAGALPSKRPPAAAAAAAAGAASDRQLGEETAGPAVLSGSDSQSSFQSAQESVLEAGTSPGKHSSSSSSLPRAGAIRAYEKLPSASRGSVGPAEQPLPPPDVATETEASMPAAGGLTQALQPQGVAGVLAGTYLLNHPESEIHIPVTQEAPATTEDLLHERQAALQQLADDLEARSKLHGRMLVSDMQAFKAANPGACLPDFVRWHSPRDWLQRADGSWGLSERMAAPGNAWQQLWEGCSALPAAEQRPLFDPVREAEKALHFLETLPSAVLHNELLTLCFSAAVGTLLQAESAALPAAAAQLRRLRELAELLLQSGTAACSEAQQQQQEAGQAADQEEYLDARDAWDGSSQAPKLPPALQAMYAGSLGRQRFQQLLCLLACVEQAVVAGQSLLQRLSQHQAVDQGSGQDRDRRGAGSQAENAAAGGGSKKGRTSGSNSEAGSPTSASSQRLALRPVISTFAREAADSLLAVALGQQTPPTSCGCATAVCVSGLHRPAVAELMQQHWLGGAAAAEQHELPVRRGSWPQAFQREWLLEVGPRVDGAGAAAVQAPAVQAQHRMYVRALPAELRIATVVTDKC